MDSTIRSLVRFVARGFYGQQYVLILDAILLHSVLSEDDLLFLLGIQRKNLRSLCNKLVEDRMLTVHSQKEELPNLRLTTRTYYYIHITEAIDSIKWKMHSVVKLIMDEMKHDGNPQGYVCPRCKSRYSQLDAISMLSDDRVNFVCDVCQGILIEDDSGIQARKRQEKLTKLMNQIDPIIGYLKKIDDSFIEDNTFESTLTKAIPAQSTPVAAYAVSTRTSGTRTNSTNNMSASLQSAAQRSQATLHVRITANDENALKESQEKTKRQEKMKQNALPSWHSESTVGKASLGRLDDEEENESAPEVKVESTADSSSRPAETKTPKRRRMMTMTMKTMTTSLRR
ncbi:hypothetical protein BABINDRAFT_133633 [Babjeviella inositovora NRRL Y-12698]|uniref:HTH TFE/IIEalpha-type domain-containing protein n=1 Tax=Babjeviella inositovora NRRL Y-12698 TaxID=984486 RepID=A0A1E3QS26_9ASCO|nr:uncharacterized protein BABINDRAFT_133633 [Babjeviella inositovora NRRL Y-12698]ODQ80438.1 hypothetical protein BABINDRAFT_133633 [Babjeviella inositovora NRRL Y-12698]